MAIQIQVRRDTAANWTSEDPTLAEGEFGMETDTFQLKIGDGATAWVGLPYVVDSANPFDQDLNTTDPVEFTGLTSNGLIYPTADGTAGQVIETDGAGVLSFVTPSGGDFLPLAGGTMTGNIVFDGTSGQFIGKGTFDTARSGNYGISIVCSVGYEFNWQAGWLITTEQSSATPRPLYLDSLAGTTLRAWDSSTSTGTEVTHLGITFADTTVQTTAYTGGAGVSSLTAGTGISLDVTTGDITVTNSEPDQTVTLTNGTGITITGTYPSFTIDCDITQYTDTDARLALSAGTGISYDDTTGIITNDEPDQTVTLTNGTDITITGTYPSFTIAYSGTAGSGTVTKTSVVSANGFAGSVATDTTTPAITITTSITGLLKGNATAISAATAGTDYLVPAGALGTPSSGTLTSCTGLPVSTGVSGLGTNVATFLATPSSANLAAALTDETGSGLAVFATSPTLTTATITSLVETKTAPAISSGTLTLNCSLGNVFAVSLNAAITTLTISNIPTTGNAFGITLAFTMDGTARAVTWGAAIKWSGGTAPTLTSTNAKVDIFVLTTWDGGTTWYAMTGGQNF